ncbi:MAG: ferrous iron transport protein B [Candidatus Eisenbacteria bacterium]|nr:ferrous iron transport protein B [Candidatus Eisenbacteria bacterium]
MAEDRRRTLTIALAGNPNSGKTSIFNALTGARQQVGNWPGVTVEKKVGRLTHGEYDIEIIDLPGTYSLTAYSVEERVARSFIIDEKPDVVIHVIDAANLQRNLYLTVQLLELGVDVVLDLNMWDEHLVCGAELDCDRLSTLFGAPVVPTVGHRAEGATELLEAAIKLAENRAEAHRHVPVSYGPHVDDVLSELEGELLRRPELVGDYPVRWVATKLLEGDFEIEQVMTAPPAGDDELAVLVDRCKRHIRTATGSDAEKIISEGRYGYIEGALRESLTEQKVDRMEVSRQIDNVFTSRYLGYPIFFLFVWLLFELTFRLGSYPMDWIDAFVGWLAGTLSVVLPESMLSSLIIDGVIGGVGSVIIFLPNIAILFLGIAFLEDSGYMARAAFLMDRVMHSLGLHGKSFIPMLMGFGCSVPAIMATRTLESSRDRILTILVVPFMSCSARLPVYLLIGGTFFAGRAGVVVFTVYLVGILMAFAVGRVLSKTLFRSVPSPFVMELPPYRLPTPRGLLVHTWERVRVYLKKMGGVILVASVVLWALGTFPTLPRETIDSYESDIETARASDGRSAEERAEELETELERLRVEHSFIGRTGKAIEPAMRPLGFTWEMGVSLVTGFVAKEVVVSTLGVLYHASAEEETETLSKALRAPSSGVTPLAAFAFMIFVLLYTPCIAAVAAIRREAGAGWMYFALAFQTGLAWLSAFGVYQVGRLLGLG